MIQKYGWIYCFRITVKDLATVGMGGSPDDLREEPVT